MSIIQLLIDVVIFIALLATIFFCLRVLKRIRNISNLEGDVGNAVALLSCQVDELQNSFQEFKTKTEEEKSQISNLIGDARLCVKELDDKIASFHTLKDTDIFQNMQTQPKEAIFSRKSRL